MASTDDGSAEQSAQQCIALTGGGERCGREATDGRFCYQHDDDDETVEEESDADAASDGSESEGTGSDATTADGESPESTDDDSGGEADDSGGNDGQPSVMAVRKNVADVTTDLIGRPLDGIIEVGKTDDGWRAVVEVVERRAVPDTQDILGRYELTLDDSETVTGYRRLGRSRRADTGSQE